MVEPIRTKFPPGFALIEETDKWIMWRVPCGCGSVEHDLTFDVEWDREINDVRMNIYGKIETPSSYYHSNWWIEKWGNICRRISIAFRVLLVGYVSCEVDLLFRTERDIRDLAVVLLDVIEKMKESSREYGIPSPSILEKSK
jgi:hypothetical protein